ncbi:ABC transporter ATP-binding protein [Stieleria sp. ICT_E10.1]|uniref:ABC transporter ATP-binding protein n=1 Tax=Stieleria sedimenti TaxID=2976331 RepID=UPI00217F3CC8|nr:ABC transporter ATP-binding protein [Stieleria sedimenti]MCS7469416.1 ABC transporter ATP-binding protein [Stieleria sedimenti]
MSTALTIDNLSKRYALGLTHSGSIRDGVNRIASMLLGRKPKQNSVALENKETVDENRAFWALRGISFEVAEGEAIGIIGRNGAGKSTLLKILSRITSPTSGRIEMIGRVASLLEVGTGFHPELTGRENMYLNGTILGMTKLEVNRQFDAIVDFAGVEKFIDTPVKRYSSGMKVRLGFAVAAHLEPEILIVDEVLAVGDAEFQSRCLAKMNDVASSGRTVIFVSHNMGVVRSLCRSAVYLRDGQVVNVGDAETIVSEYLSDAIPVAQDRSEWDARRSGSGEVVVTRIRMLENNSKKEVTEVMAGQDVTFEIEYQAKDGVKKVNAFNLGLAIHTADAQFITVLNSEMAHGRSPDLPARGLVRCRVKRFPLMSGNYQLTSTLRIRKSLSDQIQNAMTIQVVPGSFYSSGIQNEHKRQGVYIPQEWIFSDQ